MGGIIIVVVGILCFFVNYVFRVFPCYISGLFHRLDRQPIHSVLTLQVLGAHMSSRNAVTKALMKQKTGDDRAVLKKKIQDLEREWEKVCQMSVDRQSRLEAAFEGITQFR